MLIQMDAASCSAVALYGQVADRVACVPLSSLMSCLLTAAVTETGVWKCQAVLVDLSVFPFRTISSCSVCVEVVLLGMYTFRIGELTHYYYCHCCCYYLISVLNSDSILVLK